MTMAVDQNKHQIANIPHIDGLRAIAVLAVVLYHYFPTLVPGGYVGVDVFFVISGYLITGIISKAVDSGEFSFLSFYARRICRIFPPLLTVLAFCLSLGYLILHDIEYMALSKHVFATSFFLNNWVLGLESGYFDVTSESKPLLHLWSLSIEEQFYLVWPALILIMRRSMKNIVYGLIVLAVASLCYAIWAVGAKPVVGFYGPHARAWELMAGALLFLLGSKHSMKAGYWPYIGVFMLLLALGFYNSRMVYPGYYAVVPVVATLILIMAPGESVLKKILIASPVLYIGRLSYSFYLWHWPVLCFAVLFFGDNLTAPARWLLLCVCLLLSMATKNILEDRFRHGGNYFKKSTFLLLMMGSLAAIAFHIHQKEGLPDRNFHVQNVPLGSGNVKGLKSLIVKGCFMPDSRHCSRLKDAQKAEYAVIGDSKGDTLFSGIAQVAGDQPNWIYIGGNAADGAPVPNAGLGGISERYQKSYRNALDTLDKSSNIKTVVVAVALRTIFNLPVDDSVAGLADVDSVRYRLIRDDFESGLKQLLDRGLRVYLLLDNPTLAHPEKCVTRLTGIQWLDALQAPMPTNCAITLTDHMSRTDMYRKLTAEVDRSLDAKYKNFEILDPTGLVCDAVENSCPMIRYGHYIYGHTDHFSGHAAAYIGAAVLAHVRH